MEPYRSVRAWTRSLVVLVGAHVAATVAMFVAMILLRCNLDNQPSPGFAAGKLLARVGGFSGVAYVAAVVAFSFWVHRAYRNLPALGSRHARFTPGWAVGYFFIPLVMLVRGVQVMRDLWIESQPLPDDVERTLQRRAPLVGWWWGSWIATVCATQGLKMPIRHLTRDQWLALNSQVLSAAAVQVVAGALFIAVIVGIARRQREQWDDLVRRQPAPPRSDLLR